jgi:hypothetical protein
VERLWQLYKHDLSEFRDYHPGADGMFKPGHLPYYFGEPDRCGFLIRAGGNLAGFVLVSGVVQEPRHIGEFFIARSARRRRAELEPREPGEPPTRCGRGFGADQLPGTGKATGL